MEALVVQGPDRRLVPFLAEACRQARVRASKRHNDIADELGVARTTIGRWENGDMRRPDIDAIMNAYAHVAGVPVERLVQRAVEEWRAARDRPPAQQHRTA